MSAPVVQLHPLSRVQDVGWTMPPALPWTVGAACTSVGPDLWFPQPSDRAAATKAKAVCSTCPVVADCLAYALDQPESLDGIWGGLTLTERNRARRQMRQHAPRRSAPAFDRHASAVRYRNEGVPTVEIALRIGVTERTVQRLLART